MYWKPLSEYLEHLDDERILTLFVEDFKRDANELLNRCFEFIHVDASVTIDEAQVSRVKNKRLKRDMWVAIVLRHHLPGFYTLRNSVPRALRESVKRFLKRQIHTDLTWEPDVLTWTIEQLRADGTAFPKYSGKPVDFWGFDKHTQRLKQTG